MKLKYRNVVLGVAASVCLSSPAFAGGPGEEEVSDEVTSPPPVAAVEVKEEEEGFLGDWMGLTVSGSVTGISDYSFRGVSQTQTGWAGQAGATLKHDIGAYIGIWGSSLHYGGTDDAYWEQDFIAGYTNSVGDLTYDLSATYLWYPKRSLYSYWEFAAKFSYNVADMLTLKLGGLWSPDYFGTLNNAGYISTGVTYPLPIPENRFITLALDGNVGYTISDQFVYGSDNKYLDWNAGLIVGLHKNFSVDLRYVDTDLAIGSIADQRFIGGITFTF